VIDGSEGERVRAKVRDANPAANQELTQSGRTALLFLDHLLQARKGGPFVRRRPGERFTHVLEQRPALAANDVLEERLTGCVDHRRTSVTWSALLTAVLPSRGRNGSTPVSLYVPSGFQRKKTTTVMAATTVA